MKFESIVLIVLLNKSTLSFLSKLAKDLSQGSPLMALLIWSVFALLNAIPHVRKVLNRQVNSGTYHQIWLRGEDKINTGHRIIFLNMSRFINHLL